jgi:hypothetical protein
MLPAAEADTTVTPRIEPTINAKLASFADSERSAGDGITDPTNWRPSARRMSELIFPTSE